MIPRALKMIPRALKMIPRALKMIPRALKMLISDQKCSLQAKSRTPLPIQQPLKHAGGLKQPVAETSSQNRSDF
jgi:hypothetical protein